MEVELNDTIGFTVPDLATRRAAIGLEHVDPKQHKIYSDDEEFFQPIADPGPSDWLTTNGSKENKQTFEMFKKVMEPVTKTNVYLLPIGEFSEKDSPNLDILLEYSALFFGTKASLLPRMRKVSSFQNQFVFEWENYKFSITYRINGNSTQLLTKDIHESLIVIKRGLHDAYSVTAITMFDLYPSPKWNFVFGQARSAESVGVFSFIRYSPMFYDSNAELDENGRALLLRRACRVMLHEMGHMFGIKHCCYFTCLMNGSNHLDESDSHPLFLCPMDLHKLAYALGFDPLQRYQNLLQFFNKYAAFETEREWLNARLLHITSVSAVM